MDYVHKPFSPPVMKARVRTHLALRAVSEQLAEQLLTINKSWKWRARFSWRFFRAKPRS